MVVSAVISTIGYQHNCHQEHSYGLFSSDMLVSKVLGCLCHHLGDNMLVGASSNEQQVWDMVVRTDVIINHH